MGRGGGGGAQNKFSNILSSLYYTSVILFNYRMEIVIVFENAYRCDSTLKAQCAVRISSVEL